MKGTFKVKATGHEFGAYDSGIEYVRVRLEITEGKNAGDPLRWDGLLGGKDQDSATRNLERTTESLLAMGWTCEKFTELPGLGSRVADAVVEEEVWNGKTQSRVKWINAARVGLDQSVADRAGFAADMEARARLLIKEKPNLAPAPAIKEPPQRATSPAKPPINDDDIPF